jgi:hypothetical protein
MKIRVEMPADQYDELIRTCEPESSERQILMAACIETRRSGERTDRIVEILCEMEEIKKIFEFANRHCLDATKAIVKSLRLATQDPL